MFYYYCCCLLSPTLSPWSLLPWFRSVAAGVVIAGGIVVLGIAATDVVLDLAVYCASEHATDFFKSMLTSA